MNLFPTSYHLFDSHNAEARVTLATLVDGPPVGLCFTCSRFVPYVNTSISKLFFDSVASGQSAIRQKLKEKDVLKVAFKHLEWAEIRNLTAALCHELKLRKYRDYHHLIMNSSMEGFERAVPDQNCREFLKFVALSLPETIEMSGCFFRETQKIGPTRFDLTFEKGVRTETDSPSQDIASYYETGGSGSVAFRKNEPTSFPLPLAVGIGLLALTVLFMATKKN